MTSYRLFDGASGRPGVGSGVLTPPSTAVAYSGNMIVATMFSVTKMGCFLEGYWWWVTSDASTTPKKCATWTFDPTGSPRSVVPGSIVTSGTLSVGMNYIPLPTPVPLAIGTPYLAAIGVNGPFYDTISKFNSGDTYSGGITNGPLRMYSGNTGSYSLASTGGLSNNLFTTGGNDPAVTFANTQDTTGDGGTLFWLDVQVSDSNPAGYSGSYRYMPNNLYKEYNSGLDDNTPYSLALGFSLAVPCALNKIWFFSPPNATGGTLPTRASIWQVLGANSGTRVADQQPASWSGAALSGWVSCSPAGVILPPGTYKATCYNKNGAGAAWSYKRLGWFADEAGFRRIHSGANSWGPLSVPDAAGSPLAYHWDGVPGHTPPYSDGTTLTGQSTFSYGDGSTTGDPYPYLYVSQADANGQFYGVDVEVTPIAVKGMMLGSVII